LGKKLIGRKLAVSRLNGEDVQKKLRNLLILTCCLFLGSCGRGPVTGKSDPAVAPFLDIDLSSEPIFPPLGKWLLYQDLAYADWLGGKYLGKKIREPINVVIVDGFSQNPVQAVEKLLGECKAAGYEEEYGHSSGYMGLIDGVFYHQIPDNRHMAFANHDFFRTNNHGRIIGPALFNGAYVFIAGFSTEKPTIFKGFRHLFVSFNRARNDFAVKLNGGPVYKISGSVVLGNRISTEELTTGDHDGRALVLQAVE